MAIRISFYILFSVFAAPIEIWANIINSFGKVDPQIADDLFNHPWSGGLLYVLAIVLLAETVFRMTTNWEIVESSFIGKAAFFLPLAALLIAGGFYFGAERLRIAEGSALYDSDGSIQTRLAVGAMVVAWLSFVLVEFHEWKKRKAVRALDDERSAEATRNEERRRERLEGQGV